MRVVAGIHKGRKLKAVSGKATRPTTDKVKEAVFQVIGPFFNSGRVLDLFAGSGALGIEALSRGMDSAVFIDKQSKAVNTIYDNLKTLNITESSEVYRNEAFRALHTLAKRELQFDLILLDPPYRMVDFENLLYEIKNLGLLRENGLIFCEHDISEKLPPQLDNYSILKQSNYGDTISVTIYQEGKRKD
ncbi:16S rRNA (guanine(966)-N(2))-methyltransferase RsmD [Virgibacillus oceani]